MTSTDQYVAVRYADRAMTPTPYQYLVVRYIDRAITSIDQYLA